MPRKPPSEVIEHRISLSDFERRELKQAIDSYQQDKILENVPNLMLGGAAVGAVALAAYIAYKLYDIFPNPFDLTPEQKAGLDMYFGPIIGGQKPVRKEWVLFGTPTTAEELNTQYNINVARFDKSLQEANALIETCEKLPVIPGVFAVAYREAIKFRDSGYATKMEQVEEWKAYYMEQLGQ